MISIEIKFDFDLLRQELQQAFMPAFGIPMDIAALCTDGSGWIQDGHRILEKIPVSLVNICTRNVMQYHWSRLLTQVRQPVETIQLKCGLRAVQVLGQNLFVFFPNGCITGYTWEFKRDRGATLVANSAGSIALDGSYYVRAWLDALAELAKFEIAQHSGADTLDAQAFAQWQFDIFARKLKAEADLHWMRIRIGQELQLDRSVAAMARATISPFGFMGSMTVQQYNLVQRNKAEFDQVLLDSPNAYPLYALCSTCPRFPKSGEPLFRLKSYLRNAGLTEQGWRMALEMRVSDINFVYEFYRGDLRHAVIDYLLVRDSIGLHGFQPRWLLATAFNFYGTSATPRSTYLQAMKGDHYLFNLAHLVRLYQGNQLSVEDLKEGNLSAVLDWLCSSHMKPLTRGQRQQGIGLLVSKALAWVDETQAKAKAHHIRWAVPFNEKSVGIYQLIALRNSYDLWLEGKRMRHCVGDYAKRCVSGSSLIFSVKRGATHVATVEYKSQPSGWTLLSALGPGNTPLPQHLLSTLKTSASLLKEFTSPPQKEKEIS